jgi:hypothetical protein
MLTFLWIALNATFLQTLTVLSAMLFAPLEKRRGWQVTLPLGILFGFFLGGVIGVLSGDVTLPGRRWIIIPQDLVTLLYSYGYFRVCTKLSRNDAVYGVTCAYVIQHLLFCLTTILWDTGGLFPLGDRTRMGLDWLITLLLGGGLVWLVNRHLPYQGHYRATRQRTVMMATIVLLLAFVLSAGLWIMGSADGGLASPSNLGYDLCSCAFLLWILIAQRKEVNLLAMLQSEQQMRRKMQEQYELSSENIDAINRKCHDLKHQIAALRLIQDEQERESHLNDLEKNVLLYDTTVKTGNEVLDTVLTEKALLCEKYQIAWTCMADGTSVAFFSTVDLYTLIGNALDNAIEACKGLSPEQRVIRVTIRRECGAAVLQIANYYDRLGEIKDHLPQTTKDNPREHGYGLPSICAIVERYGGVVDIDTKDGIFLLSILIPDTK